MLYFYCNLKTQNSIKNERLRNDIKKHPKRKSNR